MVNGQNMLQTVANTMENERFELKTVAHTVEMAVSSSKMLQIAWKMVRTGNPKKNPQTKKKTPNNFLPFLFCMDGCMYSVYGMYSMYGMYGMAGMYGTYGTYGTYGRYGRYGMYGM